MAQKIHFRFSRDFKRNLWKTPKYEESFGEVSRFALLSQKNGFVLYLSISSSKPVFYGSEDSL